jgi:hypothetical protein
VGPYWRLTASHVTKQITGSGKFALNTIDLVGNADVWFGYVRELASRPTAATLKNGVEELVGPFPRADGGGTFQFGIRIAPNNSGPHDLFSLPTKE